MEFAETGGTKMTRTDRANMIHDQFDISARKFCENTDGIFCDITSVHKGELKPQNLKYRYAKIYYNAFIVEFKYTAYGIMSITNSILESIVYFDKNEDAIGIPLPFVIDHCNVDTATPLCIPLISNAEGMRQAFHCIGSVLQNILTDITRINYDTTEKEMLLQSFKKEIDLIFGASPMDDKSEKIDQVHKPFIIDEYCYRYFTHRFSSVAFIDLIKGQRKKAIKQLRKTKSLTGYEKRVLNVWISHDHLEIPDLSAIRKNAEAFNDSGVQKVDLKEFSTLFFSWILLTIGLSVPYAGIFYLLVYIEGRNSIYLMGPIYSLPYCICFAFITAIAASYFTRFQFYKLLFKKDYERYREIDAMQNGSGSDKVMNVFLILIVVSSFVGCILLSKWNLNFLQNGFIDNTSFFSLQGEYYSYHEVDRIYYKPDRINGFGETLDMPSYVLVLKNGKEIDLYEFDDISQYENGLLDHLRDHGINIEK